MAGVANLVQVAALARVLAGRVDAAAALDSAAGIAASERVAGRLMEMLRALASSDAQEDALSRVAAMLTPLAGLRRAG